VVRLNTVFRTEEVAASRSAGGSKPVYVVDEDRVLRRLTFEFLSAHQFAPRAYATAQDFLENVPHLPPGCLVLGSLSAHFGASQVIGALGQRIAEFPVVVTAFQGDVASAVQAMKLGASDVLESPFDRNVLPAMLEPIFVALNRRVAEIRKVNKACSLVHGLTRREREVLGLLLCGLSNKDMSARMELSVRTVEEHRAAMMSRLQVTHVSEALQIAFNAGLTNQVVGTGLGQDQG
jgi:two-component system response regulator FixJ